MVLVLDVERELFFNYIYIYIYDGIRIIIIIKKRVKNKSFFPIKKSKGFFKNQINMKERGEKGDLAKEILKKKNKKQRKKEEEEESWLPYFNRSDCSKFEF